MILKLNGKSNSKQAVRAYRLLMGFPMEDTFTVALQTATKNFQREKGLKADGIAGPQTFAALVETLPDVLYKDYSGSVYVRAVQALVGAAADGKYGANTRANVMAFQTTAGLERTGNVTKNDWLALFDCPYTRTAKASGTNTEKPVDYKQGDRRWGSIVYTSCGNKKQTIANSGCGPTSMADIMATWIRSRLWRCAPMPSGTATARRTAAPPGPSSSPSRRLTASAALCRPGAWPRPGPR